MKELTDNLLKLQTLQFAGTATAGLAGQIPKLRAKIPAQILDHYDRLVARGKKGVAILRNNVCTGCHVHVPMGVTLTLMHGDDIQICESCGRYLSLAQPEETPTVAAKPVKKSRGPGKRSPQLQAA